MEASLKSQTVQNRIDLKNYQKSRTIKHLSFEIFKKSKEEKELVKKFKKEHNEFIKNI